MFNLIWKPKKLGFCSSVFRKPNCRLLDGFYTFHVSQSSLNGNQTHTISILSPKPYH